ncbi:Gfo/Idh/MocA family protein [Vallitalea guaymasensis]|uniref:Gfo/Idh/MocA family oxidoreductase n=1 Tax=Vallitalea guaymasensis TaxID=1185412 RepID=A0A8J8SCZ6_9FIRM|nr:Gfo/Idh/MocA family oxidoreductase [Vallitalea guaymasensis]QUH29936.1 Gfo/Idh/MocA family oxidoreductase [Vallitalea guaymasensis]
MEEDKLGVAIVGCGTIFENHIKAIIENDEAKLLYLVDIEEEKVKKLASQYNCYYSTNIDDILYDDSIDVVHILTPHYLHYEMAKKVLLASKHVVLEKPAAINVEDVQDLKQLSLKMNKQIAVVFQNRYNPSLVEARSIIESKRLGSVIGMRAFITWKRDEEYYNQDVWRGKWKTEGGGLLINQAIHTLDLMRWFGGRIDKIKGHVDTRLLGDVIEVEDTAEATIKFENGAIGLFYGSNNYVDNSPVEMEIVCEKGKLLLRDGALWLQDDENIQKVVSDDKIHGYKSYWGNGHKIFIDKVYKKLIEDKPVEIDIDIGLKALEIVQGIYISSEQNDYYKMKY